MINSVCLSFSSCLNTVNQAFKAACSAISSAKDTLFAKIQGLAVKVFPCLAQKPQESPQEKLERVWTRTALDPAIARINPECAEFLLKTKLAYLIASYSRPDCTDVGVRVHEGVEILVDGAFIPYEEFNERFEYDKSRECMVERAEPHRALSCVAPALGGFIFKDQYAELFPVAELTEVEYQKLKEHAGQEADNFFQLYTSPYLDNGLPTLEDNFAVGESLPSHFAARIVTSDRKVYSFSLRVDRDDLFTATSLAKSVCGTVSMDFDEPRKHDGRLVTTLPLTQETQQRLLQYVQDNRLQRFNFVDANCAGFATQLLHQLGHNVEPRLAPEIVLFEMVAGHVYRLPGVGPLLYKLFSTANKVMNAVHNALPEFIKKPIAYTNWLIERVTEYPRRFMMSTLFVLLSGTKASEKLQARFPDTENASLINSFSDFFSTEATKLSYSQELIRWMRRQPTTVLHPFVKPQMTIVPPEEAIDQNLHALATSAADASAT